MKQYIAYQGTEFTIEWYFDPKGESQALDYFEKQSKDKQRKLLNLFRLMGEQGKIFDKTKFRNEGDKIYAFIPNSSENFTFELRQSPAVERS
jgi:hypothetical protein